MHCATLQTNTLVFRAFSRWRTLLAHSHLSPSSACVFLSTHTRALSLCVCVRMILNDFEILIRSQILVMPLATLLAKELLTTKQLVKATQQQQLMAQCTMSEPECTRRKSTGGISGFSFTNQTPNSHAHGWFQTHQYNASHLPGFPLSTHRQPRGCALLFVALSGVSTI